MKIDVMKQPLSLTLVLFGLLATLFCLRATTWPVAEELSVGSAMPIASFIQRFSANFPTVSLCISVLLAFYNGLAISRTMSRHMVLAGRTYIPITLYLIISFGIWFAGTDLACMIAASLFVRATDYFLASYVRHTTFDLTFKGSLLIGIMTLVYPPAAVYIIIIPLGLPIFKRRGREIVTSLFGALFPVIIYAYIMWILDYGFIETFISLWEQLGTPAGLPPIAFNTVTNIMRLVCIGLVVLLAMSGLASFAIFSGKMRTRGRTIFTYFILVLAVACCTFLIPATGIGSLAIMAIPLVIIIPAAFAHIPGWFTGTLYILMLLSVTALNAYPFLFA